MFDMHYDLLTVAYVCYLKNDYTYLEKWCQSYRDDNVVGVIANLYFMSEEEMRRELHPNYFQKNVSVVEMFRISTEIVRKFLPHTFLVYSIEGCDYLEVSELEELHELGLRNILPVWNHPNRYGSGKFGHYGLTEEGKKLMDEAIRLGISIDLSHANKKTFYDIIDYLEEKRRENKKFFVLASHSNARVLCNRSRNLEDDQILKIGKLDGMIGVLLIIILWWENLVKFCCLGYNHKINI